MRHDVALRTLAIVAAQRMGNTLGYAGQARCARAAAKAHPVSHEQIKQRHRIGAVPLASLPRLIPSDRTRLTKPDQRTPAIEVDMHQRPRRAPAKHTECSVGQHRLKRPRFDPCIKPIKYAVEYPRHCPRDHPAPRAEHMISAFGGGTIHNRAHLCRSVQARATGQPSRIAFCAESVRSRASRWPMILAG